MAQVDDRSDVAPLQFGEGEVGELPVEFVRAEIGFVDRRPVAEVIDADLLDAVEILAPPFVMAADLHLIDAGLAVIDRRDAVLDPGREHEVGDRSISLGLSCSPRSVPGFAAGSDSFAAQKRKPSGAKSRSPRFSAMGSKSMRWADGFIAVDWGTTNRRAYLIDGAGEAADEFEDRQGHTVGADGGFPAAIAEIRQRLGDKPLLLAGMVGSNRGWKEAPYVPCPAGLDDLAQALVRPGEREAIVPGVSYIGGGRADVMRGEEVQLLGAVAAGLVDPDALVCHPGTHNKWVVLHQAQIQSFRTVMTGELFSLLKEHSILADLLDGEVAVNDVFKDAGALRGIP